MTRVFSHLHTRLPEGLEALSDLALDLRWTWSHEADRLWNMVSPRTWSATENPWHMLQTMSRGEIEALTDNAEFKAELERLLRERQEDLSRATWFDDNCPAKELKQVAYFSMEFGVGEALPMYAGGLGILAGDFLKTASDLGVPVIGVGLLYQQGYFRQILGADGWQRETFPYNDPTSLPITPATGQSWGWLRVSLELPGRLLWLRVWQARVGRCTLYLLDSNDPLNTPADRGITNKLYDDMPETRLRQEMILGIGGWRAIRALNLDPDVCHLNEGHAAFAVLERAREFGQRHGKPFAVALAATRAGNVFTTHTPVAAGFDSFLREMVARNLKDYLGAAGVETEDVLALGREPAGNGDAFNMAYLAMRGSAVTNAVSRLHEQVSRQLFERLFPRWPRREIPVTHVTNGVHVPTWDSQFADTVWTEACGKKRWLHGTEDLSRAISELSDADLWGFRCRQCNDLVGYVRERLVLQLSEQGAEAQRLEQARQALDRDVLTIGFARRFTEYKRPHLLLHDPERLTAILNNPRRPVQLIVAGKSHPDDGEGKRLVHQFVEFASRPEVRQRAVFLEDYDIAIAQQLVQGVDVWLNTPRRPWEACGTSGMKVLVNGGLNLSEMDGWWAEAYSPEVGWALGDGLVHEEPGWDAFEAGQIYDLLERQIAPDFYERNEQGIPEAWVARMRASMARLTPGFSSNRMLREYVQRIYASLARSFRQRSADGARLAEDIEGWHAAIRDHWPELRLERFNANREGSEWRFEVSVYFGGLDPSYAAVEAYADPAGDGDPVRAPMARGEAIGGAANAFVYRCRLKSERPAWHFTPRAIPSHNSSAAVPMEDAHILWG